MVVNADLGGERLHDRGSDQVRVDPRVPRSLSRVRSDRGLNGTAGRAEVLVEEGLLTPTLAPEALREG